MQLSKNIFFFYIFLFSDDEFLRFGKNWNMCNVLQKEESWHQYEMITVVCFFCKSTFSTLILNLSRIHPTNRANHPFKSGYMVSLAIFPQ